MKFKIGDIVQVKTWEEMEKEFGVKPTTNQNIKFIPVKWAFTEQMKKWCGRKVEITHANNCLGFYFVKDVETNSVSVFKFSDDMLKPLEEKYTFDGFNKIQTKVYFDERFKTTSTKKTTFFASPKLNWVINEKKKTVVLYNKLNKVIIKCHEEDTFNLETGVGLALSKFFDCKKYRAMREFFRNKRKKLDYKKYASWVILDYWGYNYTIMNKFLEELKEKSIKEIENENPKGLVTVINSGENYTTYRDWFKIHKLEGLLKRYDYSNGAKRGKEYKVLAQGLHEMSKSTMLYAIEDVNTKKVYLVGEKGLKFKK